MFAFAAALLVQDIPPTTPSPRVENEAPAAELELSGEEMLALASRAAARGDQAMAMRILELLLADPHLPLRNEARFRLAMIASRERRWADAGRLLRAILDEEPGAQRARVEMARVQAEMGNLDAARRSLREAQAGGLPPEVALQVERFSAALRSRKPFGLTIQLALAPDSNVNRATRATTLGTVLGEFDLDDEARASSGLGLKLGLEGYVRRPLGENVSVVARGGVLGDFYRRGRFNDVALLASAGPEFRLLGGQATALAGVQKRWFGGTAYQVAVDAGLQWQRPLGPRSQLRAGLSLARWNNLRNDLQDATVAAVSLGYERALSQRSGLGITLAATRQAARDAAYSLVSGQLTVTGWHELGATTLFGSASYARLEADRRLAIYPIRRAEDFLRLSVGATLRGLSWHGWAPQVKLIHERNRSGIEVYRYDRWRGEFGVVRAF